MEDGHLHSRILRSAVAEILAQVGFEKVNGQAMNILVDLSLNSLVGILSELKQALDHDPIWQPPDIELISEDTAAIESDSLNRTMREFLIDHVAGPDGSYKREELVAFLQFQLNIMKQLPKHENMSLLESLKGTPIKKPVQKRESPIDFTAEESAEKSSLKEKKYLDQDVREYLEVHKEVSEVVPSRSKGADKKEEHMQQSQSLDESLLIEERGEGQLIRENMKEYESMLSRKRLGGNYCTPCGTSNEIPLIEDLLLLSATRRVRKKRKEIEGEI